jgi:uncharacterized glyoxalase superfamily metalloenzyme YdcJ|tara:strand:+ start:108 stop:506 length:399 start_codon:yes stop_codon:yes gene_type:complete
MIEEINDSQYKIVKLTSGENIICKLVSENEKLKVSHPLRMDVVTHMTQKGMAESLNLSRWLQPFSDQKVYTINMDHVLLIANVSIGLERYYEHVLRRIEDLDYTENQIEEPKENDLLEEILEDIEPDSDTIH